MLVVEWTTEYQNSTRHRHKLQDCSNTTNNNDNSNKIITVLDPTNKTGMTEGERLTITIITEGTEHLKADRGEVLMRVEEIEESIKGIVVVAAEDPDNPNGKLIF